MNLLIITQKVDKDDGILGFFHKWILELSINFDKVSVVCLEKGNFDLIKNTKLFSLGKEEDLGFFRKIIYILRFYKYIFSEINNYDKVFVHMNEEYIILGGIFWKIFGKKIYFWRNHPNGSIFTYIAIWFSNRVFATSSFCFSAKFRKTKIMPAGIDTNRFNLENKENKKISKKILFLSRMSEIKRPDLLIDVLDYLNKKNINFEANFYGDPLIKDISYYENLKEKVRDYKLESKILFHKGVSNDQTPEIYKEHKIFINLTPDGSFDKTILESLFCGCVPLVINKTLVNVLDNDMIFQSSDLFEIADKITFWLNIDENQFNLRWRKVFEFALEKHSLNALMKELCIEIKR